MSLVLRVWCCGVAMVIMVLSISGCGSDDAFFAAVKQEDAAAVKRLVTARPSLVRAVDAYGCTGLNLAVERGDVETARVLIDAGSDVHHDCVRLGLPLQLTCFFGDRKMFDLLIEAGADINLQPKTVGSHSTAAPLHAAAGGGKLEIVRELLQLGADVNAGSFRDGRTPLMMAISREPPSNDRLAIVQLLVEHGADVNLGDEEGLTVLQYARRFNIAEITDFLVEKGARAGTRKAGW